MNGLRFLTRLDCMVLIYLICALIIVGLAQENDDTGPQSDLQSNRDHHLPTNPRCSNVAVPAGFLCRGSRPQWHWTYDVEKGGCMLVRTTCAPDRPNYFGSLRECQNQCECHLPMHPGNCRGNFPVYGFDAETESCELFVYGGCAGNLNRFRTFETCRDICMDQESDNELTVAV